MASHLARFHSFVVLWTLCCSAACFGQEPVAPARTPERTANVTVLAYYTDPQGKEHGSVYPAQVTVGGRSDNKPRVGFIESEVSATGAQWRSAGWSAAITAAQLSDFNPLAMQVTYTFEGRLDGPSAGALMTVGVLSAVRDEPIRSDAAMTGSINPDGTVGPVGGIRHKISAAATAGKKLVLIPRDTRFERDKQTGQDVDLVAHGRKVGVEVRQVGDVYAAYNLLTGKSLPRPDQPSELRVSDQITEMVQLKIASWSDQYKSAVQKTADLKKLWRGEGEFEDSLIKWLEETAATLAERSQKLRNEGEFSAAYADGYQAAVNAYLALEVGRCRHTQVTKGQAAMLDRVRGSEWLTNEIAVVAGLLRARPPRTFNQLSEYLAACNALFEALAHRQRARDQLANLPADEEQAFVLIVEAAQNQVLAWVWAQAVRDDLDFAAVLEGTPIPADAPTRELADFYRRGAAANNAVFEALIVEPTSVVLNAPAQRVRSLMDAKDHNYAVSRVFFNHVPGQLDQHLGTGQARMYAELAFAIQTHTQNALLIAKYYSLGAEMNANLYVTGVKSENALNDWLEFSEDHTRRNIGALARRGIDPSSVLQICEMGHMMRHRGLNEKLEAIGYFWHANLHATVLRYLSGDHFRAAAALRKADVN